MNRGEPGARRLWLVDGNVVLANLKGLVGGFSDLVLLAVVLTLVFAGVSSGLGKLRSADFGREVTWAMLILWPVSYQLTRFARRRLAWFQERTPLSSIALRTAASWWYLAAPPTLLGIAVSSLIASFAPPALPRSMVIALALTSVMAGALHALLVSYRPAARAACPRELRPPRSYGTGTLVVGITRSQLWGMRPTTMFALVGLLIFFTFVAAILLFAPRVSATYLAAAVTSLFIFVVSRPDFHLARCAAQLGFGPLPVLAAHLALALSLLLTGTMAAMIFSPQRAEFLIVAWGAFLIAAMITALRTLRYPRYSKRQVELRIVMELLLLAMVGIAMPPLAVPAALLLVGIAVLQHRRNRWRLG